MRWRGKAATARIIALRDRFTELDRLATDRYDKFIEVSVVKPLSQTIRTGSELTLNWISEWNRTDPKSESRRAEMGVKGLVAVSGITLAITFSPSIGSGFGFNALDLEQNRRVQTGMALTSFLLIHSSKKFAKKYSEDKKVKRLERSYKLGYRERQLAATYTPEAVPQLTPIGGKLGALVNVMNLDPNAMHVEGLGVRDGLTTMTYILKLNGIVNHADVFGLRGQVGTAISATGDVTFNWIDTVLEVEVSKPYEHCAYPSVLDYIGNDNHMILLPKGIRNGQLLSDRIDDGFSTKLMVGMSRSGKTESMKAMLQFWFMRHSPQALKVWVAEPHDAKSRNFLPEEWEWDPHLFGKLGNGKIESLQLMAAAIKESQARRSVFERAGVYTLEEYNRVAPIPMPVVIGVIDEPEELFSKSTPEVYRIAFIRMALTIAKLCASMGIKLILLPKSIAASEDDEFDVSLRRVFDPNGICLKVSTESDGYITLQANRETEWLAGEATRLPGRGAAIVRHEGTLVRTQMLKGVQHSTLQQRVIGKDTSVEWVELPTLTEVVGTYSHSELLEDGMLTAVLASEGISYQELLDLAKYGPKGKPSKPTGKSSTTDGKGKARSESAEPTPLSESDYRRLYQEYWRLTKVEGLSMTKAIERMSGTTRTSVKFKNTHKAVDHALYRNLGEILATLDPELTDEEVMVVVWGHCKEPRRTQCLRIINEVRGRLSK